MKKVVCIVAALLAFMPAHAQRNWFHEDFVKSGAINAFKSGAKWLPYPDYSDREGWDALVSPYEKEGLISKAEQNLDYKWEWPTALQYVEFERSGNRSEMERPLRKNIAVMNSLIAGELVEGKGRFIPQIADCIWLYSNQISWVFSAHNKRQPSKRALPDPEYWLIDLFSAEAGMTLSFAYHFFKEELDAIDPSICRALRLSLEEKIFKPFFEVDHWWMGKAGNVVNNWCPWCASNVLLAFLLVHDDDEVVRQAVDKSLVIVDNYMNSAPDDGACDEGAIYFAYGPCKLYDYLQIMYDASGGAFNGLTDPKVGRMADYESRCFIGRYAGKEYVVDYADAIATLSVSPALTWRYGTAVGSRETVDFSLYVMGRYPAQRFEEPIVGGRDTYRVLDYMRHSREVAAQLDSLNALADVKGFEAVKAGLRASVAPVCWYETAQQLFRRTADGTFFAAKGGHNGEPHNHNDVGQFLWFRDGCPFLIDPGAPTYTRQTFSSERYTLWPMQSQWHNLPSINGEMQHNGDGFAASAVAFSDAGATSTLSMDLSGTYPEEAACKKWRRTFLFKEAAKGASLVVTDEFALSARKAADVEHFVTPGTVTEVRKGLLRIENGGKSVLLSYPKSLEYSVETRELDDKRIADEWGPRIYRISLRSADDAPLKGKYVFSITNE